MSLRPSSLVATLFLSSSLLGAQEVRVEVVELATGKPIVGANVSLLTDSIVSIGGGFSDQMGQAVLRAPVSGTYRVRSDKVGYETWTSVILHLTPNPIHLRAVMMVSRTPSAVVTRTETACQQLNTGTPAGDLWVEMRKALAAAALTESQGLVPLDVDLYDRALDRNAAVVSERTEQRSRIARRPLTGISAGDLDTTRRGEGAGDNVYRAPELATLLADAFTRNHCFAAIRGYGPEVGLAGLEFRPSKVGGGPEIAGVLWLDPAHSALKSLAFDYVNLPIPLRVARTTGRLDFQQLENGQWIIPRWFIRMPRVAQIRSSEPNAPTVTRDSLVGFQEVGGMARLAGTAAPASTTGAQATTGQPAQPAQGLITGIVYDSTSGRPLKDVQVSIGGGRFKAVTNDGGRYEMAVDGGTSDKLIFDHPRLRLFHVAERVQNVSAVSGSVTPASVIVPSYATLRKKLCAQNETGTEAEGMAVGYVRDESGSPIFNAHVWATWQIQWIEQNGKLISTNQRRVVETDTGPDGSYMMCGFTRGAQITAKVSMAGKGIVEEKVTMPAALVLEHDFVLAARR
jgi:hypothetical protein